VAAGADWASFEEAFLSGSAECLMLVDESTQKCFSLKACRDSGKLCRQVPAGVEPAPPRTAAPPSSPATRMVIRARLSGRQVLSGSRPEEEAAREMASALAGITFHEKLGSQKETG